MIYGTSTSFAGHDSRCSSFHYADMHMKFFSVEMFSSFSESDIVVKSLIIYLISVGAHLKPVTLISEHLASKISHLTHEVPSNISYSISLPSNSWSFHFKIWEISWNVVFRIFTILSLFLLWHEWVWFQVLCIFIFSKMALLMVELNIPSKNESIFFKWK